MSARVAGDAGLVEALRARRDKGKEPIEREAMQDGRVSMKARGILGYLVSKPDKWRTNAQSIADECECDGRDSIAAGLKELEAKGYLARKRRPGPDGRFVWCWIYSDDPDEVAEVLDEMFPDGSGAKPDVRRRGRARTKTLGGKPVVKAAHAISEESQVEPINGFPVDGSSVDGSPVDGKPVDIESKREINPPNPPRSGGDEVPPASESPSGERCETHRRLRCRDCGLSPRVQARAEREREAADAEAAEARGRACTMCAAHGGARSDGQPSRWLRVDPTSRTFLSPLKDCDHQTPHAEVMAQIQAAEEAAEAARAAAAAKPAEPVAVAGRAAAREIFKRRPCSPARVPNVPGVTFGSDNGAQSGTDTSIEDSREESASTVSVRADAERVAV